jgi:hypothetical protein
MMMNHCARMVRGMAGVCLLALGVMTSLQGVEASGSSKQVVVSEKQTVEIEYTASGGREEMVISERRSDTIYKNKTEKKITKAIRDGVEVVVEDYKVTAADSGAAKDDGTFSIEMDVDVAIDVKADDYGYKTQAQVEEIIRSHAKPKVIAKAEDNKPVVVEKDEDEWDGVKRKTTSPVKKKVYDLHEALAFIYSLGLPSAEGLKLVYLEETITYEPAAGKEELASSSKMKNKALVWLKGENEKEYDILYAGVLPQRALKEYRYEEDLGTLKVIRKVKPYQANKLEPAMNTWGAAGVGRLLVAAQLNALGRKDDAIKVAATVSISAQQRVDVDAVKNIYSWMARLLIFAEQVRIYNLPEKSMAEKEMLFRKAVALFGKKFSGAQRVDWELAAVRKKTAVEQKTESEDKEQKVAAKDKPVVGDSNKGDKEEVGGAGMTLYKNLIISGRTPELFELKLFRPQDLTHLDGWRCYLRNFQPTTESVTYKAWHKGAEAYKALAGLFADSSYSGLLMMAYKKGDANSIYYVDHYQGTNRLANPFHWECILGEHQDFRLIMPARINDVAASLAFTVVPTEDTDSIGTDFVDMVKRRHEGIDYGTDRKDFLQAMIVRGSRQQIARAVKELAALDMKAAVEVVETAMTTEKRFEKLQHDRLYVALTTLAKQDKKVTLELVRTAIDTVGDGWERDQLKALLVRMGDTEAQKKSMAKVRSLYARLPRDKREATAQEMMMGWSVARSLPKQMRYELLKDYKNMRPDGVLAVMSSMWMFNGTVDDKLKEERIKVLQEILNDRRAAVQFGVGEVRWLAAVYIYCLRQGPEASSFMREYGRKGGDVTILDWLLQAGKAKSGEYSVPRPTVNNADAQSVDKLLAVLFAAKDSDSVSKALAGVDTVTRVGALARLMEYKDAASIAVKIAPVVHKITKVEVLGKAESTSLSELVRKQKGQVLGAVMVNAIREEFFACKEPVALHINKAMDGSGFHILLYYLAAEDLPPVRAGHGLNQDTMMTTMLAGKRAYSNSPGGAKVEGNRFGTMASDKSVAEIIQGLDALPPQDYFTIMMTNLVAE